MSNCFAKDIEMDEVPCKETKPSEKSLPQRLVQFQKELSELIDDEDFSDFPWEREMEEQIEVE